MEPLTFVGTQIGRLKSFVSDILKLEQSSIGYGESTLALRDFDYDRIDEIAYDLIGASVVMEMQAGKLWISAAGIGSEDDRDNGKAYSAPQVLYPPDREPGSEDHLDFIRWQFDQRLEQEGMAQVINQICTSFAEYGHAILELELIREEGPAYPGKIVAKNFLVHNPRWFVIDPKGLKPGIYLKSDPYVYAVSAKDRLPDKRFMIFTFQKRYGDPHGKSVYQMIDKTLQYFWNVLDVNARGLENSGVGKYIVTPLRNLSDKATALLEAVVKKMRGNTVTILPNGTEVQALPVSISDEAFEKFKKGCLSLISLIATGSPTKLIENEYGTYSSAEVSEVGGKSDREQYLASVISEGFSFQVIPCLLDFNYSTIEAYPEMRLIEPQLTKPTLSKQQQDLVETQADQANDNQDTDKDKPQDKNTDTKLEKADESAKNTGQKPGQKAEQKEFSHLPIEAERDRGSLIPANAVYFAEGATSDKNDNEQDPEKNLKGFPIQAPAPEIYEEVKLDAENYLRSMPVLNPRDYKKLSDEDKHNTFTISALRNAKDPEGMIEKLKQAIAETLNETNEANAWAQYRKAAFQIFRDSGYTLSDQELIPSFRFARGKAYASGTDRLIESGKRDIFAIRLMTQDDSRVRHTHSILHGLTRPVNDPIWKKIQLPMGFNDRCYKDIITKEMYARRPEEYQVTPDDKMPEHIPAPFEDGYLDEDEQDDDENI